VETAAVAIIALCVSVSIGFYTRINLGIICIGAAFLAGYFFMGMNPTDIYMEGFPLRLFFLLLGTTLFSSIAKLNGTYAELAKPISYLTKGSRKYTCFVIYAASFVFSSLGMGTIVTPAIMLPLMLEAARKNEIPEFLAILLTLSGSLAGGLSSLAPTGLLGTRLSRAAGVDEYAPVYIASVATFTLQGLIFFLLFGGLKLTRLRDREPEPMILNGGQFFTILTAFGVITAITAFKLDIGLSAFVGAAVLLLSGIADEDKAVAGVAWDTLLLIGGAGVLFHIVSESGGISALESYLIEKASPETAGVFTAFFAGAMSVVSSPSAVVMPTLIPAVRNISQSLGEDAGAPIYLIAAIIIGAHSVAYSPVSTIGALGMASSSAGTNKHRLFSKLLLAAAVMFFVTTFLFWSGFYGALKERV
jgi:di/tricarboxylate transporter